MCVRPESVCVFLIRIDVKKKEIGGVGTKLYPDAGAHHPPGNTYTPRHHLLGMIVAVLKLQLLNLNARHLLALKQQYR